MSVRDARSSDLPALVALERACYPPEAACEPREVRQWLRLKAVNLVWEDGRGILGYVGATFHRGWRRGEVFAVSVHPDARGLGVARALLAEAEGRLLSLGMRRVVLQVNASNVAAIRLYERAGYVLVKRLVDYYRFYEDRDALLYARDLGNRSQSPSTSGVTPSQSGSQTGTSKRA
ncbi:MAG: GNAT family N-acetyltransferase [Myxococcota bacterium]